MDPEPWHGPLACQHPMFTRAHDATIWTTLADVWTMTSYDQGRARQMECWSC